MSRGSQYLPKENPDFEKRENAIWGTTETENLCICICIHNTTYTTDVHTYIDMYTNIQQVYRGLTEYLYVHQYLIYLSGLRKVQVH